MATRTIPAVTHIRGIPQESWDSLFGALAELKIAGDDAIVRLMNVNAERNAEGDGNALYDAISAAIDNIRQCCRRA